MEGTKTINVVSKIKSFPLFLVAYIIFSAIATSIWSDRAILFEELCVVALSFLFITTYLCLIKNSIVRLLLFLVLVIFIFLRNQQYAFCFVPAGAVFHMYKELVSEEKEKNIYTAIYSILFCVSIILNFINLIKNYYKYKFDDGFLNALLIGFFLCAIFILALKNMKKDRRNFKKTIKKPYLMVFVMAIVGIINSLAAYDVFLNNRIVFSPWFLFLCVLIYEKDVCIYNFVNVFVKNRVAEKII